MISVRCTSVARVRPRGITEAKTSYRKQTTEVRLGAPDEEVLLWNSRGGKGGGQELHEGKPTRSLRAKYILRDRSVDARVARMYLRSLGDLTEIIQSQKHGLRRDDVDAVAPLLPTVEGLLVFLFVSRR